MEKPVSIRIEEFKNTIVKATNESGLPASVLKEVLGGLFQEINQLAIAELERDKKALAESADNIIVNKEE